MNMLFVSTLAFLLCFSRSEVTSCECGQEKIVRRIIGGTDAKPNRYPWMVYLETPIGGERFSTCGGTLINDRYILTAAHCIQEEPFKMGIQVLFGLHDKRNTESVARVSADKIIVHPKYSIGGMFSSAVYDIALIRLPGTVRPEWPLAKPICLWKDRTAFDNSFATGWGRNEYKTENVQNVLQEVSHPVISDSECKRASGFMRGMNVDSKICAGDMGKSVCFGDSGGPLATRSQGKVYQVGITSYVYPNCGEYTGKPAVFTRVSAYYDWIMENTRDAMYCN